MVRGRKPTFQPRLGRIRYQSGQKQARSYLSRVQRSISRAGSIMRSAPGATSRTGSYAGRRRVIVKARIVKLTSSGRNGLAQHLRYISRESATHDQDKGKLFGADTEDARRDLFVESASEDRHHFRFIISPEDGAELTDFKPFVRDLIRGMEHDLGTRLDWVSAVHYNTAHPHAHIVVRGRCENGQDLVIPRAYISHGIRERAVDLVTLELGPETRLERDQKLARERHAERLTRTDRSLLRLANERGELDLAKSSLTFRTQNTARLKALEKMRLATRTGETKWTLDTDLQPKLQALGERQDILKTLSHASNDRPGRLLDADHSLSKFETAEHSIVGTILETGLTGDFHDGRYVILDTRDGRILRSKIDDNGPIGLRPGMIIELKAKDTQPKPSDKTIAAIAKSNNGLYSPTLHQAHYPRASQSFIQAHIRRLEALRRSGKLVERMKDGSWRIPADHLANVESHQQQSTKLQPRQVKILSGVSLTSQIADQGLTWLDYSEDQPGQIKGFGADIQRAKAARQRYLVDRGLLQSSDHKLFDKQIETLRRQGLDEAGKLLATRLGKDYHPAPQTGKISGKFTQHIDLPNGRYAVLERKHKFTLVRWRQILERGRGHTLTGHIQGHKLNWDFGAQRQRGLSR